jgi:hypothetical protein
MKRPTLVVDEGVRRSTRLHKVEMFTYLVMDETRKPRITKDTTTSHQRQLDEVEAKSAKDNRTLLVALMQEPGT